MPVSTDYSSHSGIRLPFLFIPRCGRSLKVLMWSPGLTLELHTALLFTAVFHLSGSQRVSHALTFLQKVVSSQITAINHLTNKLWNPPNGHPRRGSVFVVSCSRASFASFSFSPRCPQLKHTWSKYPKRKFFQVFPHIPPAHIIPTDCSDHSFLSCSVSGQPPQTYLLSG